jgi:hypothetical protein
MFGAPSIDLSQPSPDPSVPPEALSSTPNPPSWLSLDSVILTPPRRRDRDTTPQSLHTNDYVNFTRPSPASSVPSAFSVPSVMGTGDQLTTENLQILDGLGDPNISRNFPPLPERLDRSFCNPHAAKFYVVTSGWEVGIFDNWYVWVFR